MRRSDYYFDHRRHDEYDKVVIEELVRESETATKALNSKRTEDYEEDYYGWNGYYSVDEISR